MHSKIIKFNLPLVIPNNQLIWTNHALKRMEERKITLPEHRARWELIENRRHFEKSTWTMRLRRRHCQDLIIVVDKESEAGKYVVVTCYWDEALAA